MNKEKNIIVIPVKRHSQGLPNKNRLLIQDCINKIINISDIDYELHIIGDDYDLFDNLKSIYKDKIKICKVPLIDSLSDVTLTLRFWRDTISYSGKIAMVQCTSPKLQEKWIIDCLNLYKSDKIVATTCEIGFKPTALYCKNGDYYTLFAKDRPWPSTARQLLPHTIRITGAIFVFHTNCLDNQSLFENKELIPYMIDEKDNIDIDTIEDLMKLL